MTSGGEQYALAEATNNGLFQAFAQGGAAVSAPVQAALGTAIPTGGKIFGNSLGSRNVGGECDFDGRARGGAGGHGGGHAGGEFGRFSGSTNGTDCARGVDAVFRANGISGATADPGTGGGVGGVGGDRRDCVGDHAVAAGGGVPSGAGGGSDSDGGSIRIRAAAGRGVIPVTQRIPPRGAPASR